MHCICSHPMIIMCVFIFGSMQHNTHKLLALIPHGIFIVKNYDAIYACLKPTRFIDCLILYSLRSSSSPSSIHKRNTDRQGSVYSFIPDQIRRRFTRSTRQKTIDILIHKRQACNYFTIFVYNTRIRNIVHVCNGLTLAMRRWRRWRQHRYHDQQHKMHNV